MTFAHQLWAYITRLYNQPSNESNQKLETKHENLLIGESWTTSFNA